MFRTPTYETLTPELTKF